MKSFSVLALLIFCSHSAAQNCASDQCQAVQYGSVRTTNTNPVVIPMVQSWGSCVDSAGVCAEEHSPTPGTRKLWVWSAAHPEGRWLCSPDGAEACLFKDGVQVGIRHADGSFQSYDPVSRTFGAKVQGATIPKGEIIPVKPTPLPTVKFSLTNHDALSEVNAARANHGLAPFARDDAMTQGALACAQHRAANRIVGHSTNDFSFLPSGASASAAGCAAWSQGDGWGACCTYDNYSHAGAAAVIGADGKRYMQLFVR